MSHTPKSSEFEELLSGLATALAAVEDRHVDAPIDEAVAAIGRYFVSDRCFVNQFSLDKTTFRTTHMWEAKGIATDTFIRETALSEQFPWYTERILAGKDLVFESATQLPAGAAKEFAYATSIGIEASAIVPLEVGGDIIGNYGLDMIGRTRSWEPDEVSELRVAGAVLAGALQRKRDWQRLDGAFLEIAKLRDRLQAENTYLQTEIRAAYRADEIIGDSAPIRRLFTQIEQVAASDSTVLITGETGTGKELVARAIHAAGPRRQRPLVKVDCAGLPPTLVESELFGHKKGAYTGAAANRQGRFELGDGGTLFLDEIGDMDIDIQAKLLRVLQDGEFERVGESKTHKVDVRIIAATNRDLDTARQEGRFRDDLFYRLNVFPIQLPPLRTRTEDIPLLTWAFVERESNRLGKRIDEIPAHTMNELTAYEWPGNVRELENVIERAVVVTPENTLRLAAPLRREGPTGDGPFDAAGPMPPASGPSTRLVDLEREHIRAALAHANWKVSGPGGAAARLGLNESTLRYRMKKHGIQRPW